MWRRVENQQREVGQALGTAAMLVTVLRVCRPLGYFPPNIPAVFISRVSLGSYNDGLYVFRHK